MAPAMRTRCGGVVHEDLNRVNLGGTDRKRPCPARRLRSRELFRRRTRYLDDACRRRRPRLGRASNTPQPERHRNCRQGDYGLRASRVPAAIGPLGHDAVDLSLRLPSRFRRLVARYLPGSMSHHLPGSASRPSAWPLLRPGQLAHRSRSCHQTLPSRPHDQSGLLSLWPHPTQQ